MMLRIVVTVVALLLGMANAMHTAKPEIACVERARGSAAHAMSEHHLSSGSRVQGPGSRVSEAVAQSGAPSLKRG